MPINTRLSNNDYQTLIESIYQNDISNETRFNKIKTQIEWRKHNLNSHSLLTDMQTLINLEFIASFSHVNELFNNIIHQCHKPEKTIMSKTIGGTIGSKNRTISANYEVHIIPFSLIVQCEFKNMLNYLPKSIAKWIETEIDNTEYIHDGETKNVFDMLESQLNRHAPLMESFNYLMLNESDNEKNANPKPSNEDPLNTTKRLLKIRSVILKDQLSENKKQYQVAEIDYLLIIRSAQKQIYHKLIRWYRINLIKNANPNYKFIISLLNQHVNPPLNHIRV